ncbi:MAG: zinc-ribbon domain-containing protein [Bacilli bacterium]|nr:zinc-ribbon domain-containing protein [Bacilli bacterium]
MIWNKPLSPGSVTYGSHKKVWWRCENGHEWEAVIKSRTHDHGCPYCSPTYKKVLAGQNDLVTWCKEKGMTLLLSEWDYEANGNLKPEMFTAGSHARIHWVCSEGHRWTAVIKERTKKNGYTCPFCKKKTVK